MYMNDCGRNHPDAALVDNCGRCGAPVCCSWCCEVDALEARIAELRLDIIAATGQAQTALEENAKLRTLAKAHDLNDYKTYIKWRGIEAGWDRELTPTELGDIIAAAALKEG